MIHACKMSRWRAEGRLVVGALLLAWVLPGCGQKAWRSDISYSRQQRLAPQITKPNKRPPTAQTLYTMARILATQHKDEKCHRVLTRLIQDHPRFMPAYCELAELHLRHERIDEALLVLTKGLELSPNDPYLLNNVGMCLMLSGDHEQALAAFTEAAGEMPLDARYRASMAACLGAMGRYEESLALYKQVVPTEEAYFNLGILCKAQLPAAAARDPGGSPQEKAFTLAASPPPETGQSRRATESEDPDE